MKAWLSFISIILVCGACIGVDRVDDPVVGASIEVTSSHQVALMPGEMAAIMAEYFDRYGIKQPVDLMWSSSNTHVAAVNDEGVVTALSVGQAVIQAIFDDTFSIPININVVDDADAVAVVEIVPPPSTVLSIGEDVILTAEAKNISGMELEGKMIEWFSENASILSVNSDGTVLAVENDVAGIHAKVEGVKSNSINFTVGNTRDGTFVSAGGYTAVGTATLAMEDGKLTLKLSDNFSTSFALGTYIYLSNTTSGSGTRANGVEIQQITTNGAHTFDISTVDPTIGLYDYRYVIVLCKPASVTFGYADLN